MRLPLIVLALLAGSCRQEQPDSTRGAAPGGTSAMQTYVGQGRDRLCLDQAGGRIGLITYGQGDANCSLRGAFSRQGQQVMIIPDGDESCRVSATLAGGQLRLGPITPQCSYYCGPGADLSGRQFRISGQPQRVNDLAGDPLC